MTSPLRARIVWNTVARALSPQGLLTMGVVLLFGALVLYPFVFLGQVALNTGDPQARPPQEYGLSNFAGLLQNPKILGNTMYVAIVATALALVFGFANAWILFRTCVPGQQVLEQLIAFPYYLTPLVGALAWSVLASPRRGFLNQLWYALGGVRPLLNINTPLGIAWVMALFEGTVAFVMIAAAMKSMDPSLEEVSHVLGAGKLRTLTRVTLPMVAPAILGTAVFVFAELLGSFSAPLILGSPARFYVVTTAIWELAMRFPPDYPLAAAMGLSLSLVMLGTMYFYRRIITSRSYVTITGKAFRPRRMEMGRLTWPLFGVVSVYVMLAAVLPVVTLLWVSFQRLASPSLGGGVWTLGNYATALGMGPIRAAIGNSLVLGFATATLGTFLMGLLAWIIYRSHLPGRGVVEYVVMFPAAVPRMVLALGMLWAWTVFPIPIYGTLWLLLLAYLTVFLPLGVRTIASVILQLDQSVEECARVCGASWFYQLRTVTVPLLRPGLIAAWMLLFIASARELGTSILLTGPDSKVIAPAIVDAWSSSGTEITAAMALIQTALVGVAWCVLLGVTRRVVGFGTD